MKPHWNRVKFIRVVPDKEAESHDLLRVIDESEKDYLFPASLFAPISLPQTLAKELALLA